jgi:hypothetical protein
MIKMPEQFRGWFTEGVQLSEEIGERLGRWAKGDAIETPQDAPQGETQSKYRDDAGEVCAAIMDASSLDIVAQIFQSFNAINKEYSPADRKLIIQAKDDAKARLSE